MEINKQPDFLTTICQSVTKCKVVNGEEWLKATVRVRYDTCQRNPLETFYRWTPKV